MKKVIAAWAFCMVEMCALTPAGAATPSDAVGWPFYNGDLHSDRFSSLDRITPKNAADLREICEASLGDPGPFQAGPIVIGDTLFVTTVHTVVALSAIDCSERWRYVYRAVEDEPMPGNRGVAYADGRIFRGTGDGRLVAIDAANGKEIWRVQAADPKRGEFLSAAPIAWNGRVYIGPAGSDWGIQGRVSAFDAATGRELWRFNTVPLAGEAGYETWEIPATAIHGGGGTWTSYTLDADTGELFASVANPAPDYDPGGRPGKNLYTNSLIVLDAATGALKWYYQVDDNDGFDYDLAAAPVLFTDNAGNRRIALGSKDGYLYILDRQTHALVSKTAVTSIERSASAPTRAGVRACPGTAGGVQWNGPAYSPITDLVYIGSVDWCSVFFLSPQKYESPLTFTGTGAVFGPDEAKTGWIYGVHADTGATAWRYHSDSPVLSGATPTAGGLVFSGNAAGDLLVLDAKTGALLEKRNLGGSMGSGVVTYAIGATQYVATTAGNISRGGWAPVRNRTPRVVIMTTRLNATSHPLMVAVARTHETIGDFGGNPGRSIFNVFCAPCHGLQGTGGAGGPALQNEAARKSLAQIIAFIKAPVSPMPSLYLHPLTESEISAVARYVHGLSDNR